MPYLRPLVCFFTLCLLPSAFTPSLDARVRGIDHSKRSSLSDKIFTPEKFDTGTNNQFSNKSFEITEWHTKFSPLGRERSNMNGETSRFNGDTQERQLYNTQPSDSFESSRSRFNRQIANSPNLDHVREMYMASRFSDGEITSPTGRQFAELVDQVSLRDINRFQAMRNKTDDGIPVDAAGGEGSISVDGKSIGVERNSMIEKTSEASE